MMGMNVDFLQRARIDRNRLGEWHGTNPFAFLQIVLTPAEATGSIWLAVEIYDATIHSDLLEAAVACGGVINSLCSFILSLLVAYEVRGGKLGKPPCQRRGGNKKKKK
jgi:hypothetical protein